MAAISLLSQKIISSLFLALQILGKYVFLCQMYIFLDSCTPHVIHNSQMFSFTPRNIIYQVIKKFFTSFPLKMFAFILSRCSHILHKNKGLR